MSPRKHLVDQLARTYYKEKGLSTPSEFEVKLIENELFDWYDKNVEDKKEQGETLDEWAPYADIEDWLQQYNDKLEGKRPNEPDVNLLKNETMRVFLAKYLGSTAYREAIMGASEESLGRDFTGEKLDVSALLNNRALKLGFTPKTEGPASLDPFGIDRVQPSTGAPNIPVPAGTRRQPQIAPTVGDYNVGGGFIPSQFASNRTTGGGSDQLLGNPAQYTANQFLRAKLPIAGTDEVREHPEQSLANDVEFETFSWVPDSNPYSLGENNRLDNLNRQHDFIRYAARADLTYPRDFNDPLYANAPHLPIPETATGVLGQGQVRTLLLDTVVEPVVEGQTARDTHAETRETVFGPNDVVSNHSAKDIRGVGSRGTSNYFSIFGPYPSRTNYIGKPAYQGPPGQTSWSQASTQFNDTYLHVP